MPVESEQAQASGPLTARPLKPGSAMPEPVAGERDPHAPEPVAGAPRASASRPGAGRPAAPRPPHDRHELPDGRYLIAYRSAPNA